MTLGKCAVGVWLILIPIIKRLSQDIKTKERRGCKIEERSQKADEAANNVNGSPDCVPPSSNPSSSPYLTDSVTDEVSEDWERTRYEEDDPPLSGNFIAALLLALAMTARGEIGYLIAAVGFSSSVLTEEIYLIAVWAITLCTFLAPIGVGFIVRKIEKAEASRPGMQILGVWR